MVSWLKFRKIDQCPVSNYGFLVVSFLSIKNQRGLDANTFFFNNDLPTYLTITKIARLNAKSKSRNRIEYRWFIMIPVVLIVETDSVYKCFTTQGRTIKFLVSFSNVLLCKYFVFLPRLSPSSNVTSLAYQYCIDLIRRRSNYIIGFIAPAIGPNKSKKLTRLIAPAHNIRGKVWMKNNIHVFTDDNCLSVKPCMLFFIQTLPRILCAGAISQVSFLDLFGPIAGAINPIM